MIRSVTYSAPRMAACAVIAVFYAAYFLKMLRQRRKGITTDVMAKGDKPKALRRQEAIMKAATALVVPVELGSIFWDVHEVPLFLRAIGLAVAAAGTAVFIASMSAMRDSWRAGIPDKTSTALITDGIYRFSRNPAFLGFDLLYLGLLAAYPNAVHLGFAVFAILMLHKQILNEEAFLQRSFGEAYSTYKSQVRRYL